MTRQRTGHDRGGTPLFGIMSYHTRASNSIPHRHLHLRLYVCAKLTATKGQDRKGRGESLARVTPDSLQKKKRDPPIVALVQPGLTTREGRVAGSRRKRGGPTSTGLGSVSTPTLASPGGTSPAGLSALDRAPPPELSGPGRPCRPLGLGIRGEAGPAGAEGRQANDAPAYSTPTSK